MAPSAVAEAAAGADVGANGRGGGGGGVRRAAAHKRERAAQPPAATGAVYEVVVGGERRRAVWDAQAARARLVPARSAAGEASSGAEGADGGGAAAAWRAVQRAFLPANVTSDYWEYARWRCCQRVASSMLNVLATQQMLYAIGIGAERGLAAAAVVNWVLKDGLGRLGKLAVSTRLGSSFDADLKQYRFSSSVVYNVAHALEFTTALVPQHFLVLATVANIGKSIGVSTSMSITPAIHRSFAMSENMADVSAKNQAQQVVADNVGLALAVGLSKWWAHVSPSKAAVTLMPFAAYPVLAGLDMFCIRNELRAVALRTLNVTRAELAADEWLRRGGGAGGGGAAGGAHTRGAVGGDRGSGGALPATSARGDSLMRPSLTPARCPRADALTCPCAMRRRSHVAMAERRWRWRWWRWQPQTLECGRGGTHSSRSCARGTGDARTAPRRARAAPERRRAAGGAPALRGGAACGGRGRARLRERAGGARGPAHRRAHRLSRARGRRRELGARRAARRAGGGTPPQGARRAGRGRQARERTRGGDG